MTGASEVGGRGAPAEPAATVGHAAARAVEGAEATHCPAASATHCPAASDLRPETVPAAERSESPPGIWNVANMLTMMRLLMVPVFVSLLFASGGHDPKWRAVAWASFAIAMITDLFDGELARRKGLVTDFGKIADPIADKAIMGAALIGLSMLGDLPWWVTAVILARELGITLMRFWVIKHGVIPASRGGKLKTLTQGIAVGMYVLELTGWLATARAVLMSAAVLLTLGTGVDYVRQAVRLRRAGLARARSGA
jgi:CDP-diacylglycerol--glycerol-3-phosphate 3-phosphatidyltransferase